jgi:putative solute:sodium symporter small subunit
MYIEHLIEGKRAAGSRHTHVAEDDQNRDNNESANNSAYWRANLKLGGILLAIWFIVSFGFGILLVEPLNQIPFFGFKLGFWWAQQGAIYVFIVLIFVYAAAMKRLDRKYDVHDDD